MRGLLTITGLLVLGIQLSYKGAPQDSEAPAEPAPPEAPEEATAVDLTVTSEAFADGEAIPVVYTCDGEDRSPPLAWSELPEGTASVAVFCDDPDAPGGTWIHWVLYGLPAGTVALDESAAAQEPPAGGFHGLNSWKKAAWGGPCPPPGPGHRYVFTVVALDAPLDLPAGAPRDAVDEAIQGHVLARGTVMGRYKRAN